jgi:hypothetical protein
LPPWHLTIGAVVASTAKAGAIANIEAAPTARAAPVNCNLFIKVPFKILS